MRLQDQIVVINGYNAITKAAAALFSAEGAKVVLVSSDPEAGAAAQAAGGLHLCAEFSDGAAGARLAAQIKEACSRIDVLVNNTGIAGAPGALTELHDEDWHDAVKKVLGSAFFAAKYIGREMEAERKGSVLFVSSLFAVRTAKACAVRTAASAGLLGIAHAFAADLGKSGIRVNSVLPGPVGEPAGFAPYPILGRSASADEVARALLFFASEDSSHVTGTELIVDGGARIW